MALLSLCIVLLIALSDSESVYYGVSDTATYSGAKSACSGLNGVTVTGQLATWGSDEEFDAIKEVRSQLSWSSWVGLNDLNGEANWQFVDGDTSYCKLTDSAGTCDELNEWAAGEPNNVNDEDCAELYSGGDLNDEACSDEQPFICEIIIDGDYYSNTFYIGVESNKNYADAKLDCAGLDSINVEAQLATFSNSSDFEEIKSVMNDLGADAWIGLDDLNSEANWQFVDGDTSYCYETDSAGTCDELNQWDDGEPNDYGNNEDCAEILTSGYLNDRVCSAQRAYICEIIIDGDTSVETGTNIAAPIDEIPNNPIPNLPLSSPSDNIYIFEFTSNKSVILFVSVLLNVVFIGCVCYSMIKLTTKIPIDTYSKVDIDEKI